MFTVDVKQQYNNNYYLWDHESLFETRVAGANEGWIERQVRWHNRNYFSIFFNMKVRWVFSLESPHRGDSNEYKQHAIIYITKKITLNYPKYNNVCSYWIFFQGTQERVRNSPGKRAIGVRAIEVLLYMHFFLSVSLRISKDSVAFTIFLAPSINRQGTLYYSAGYVTHKL